MYWRFFPPYQSLSFFAVHSRTMFLDFLDYLRTDTAKQRIMQDVTACIVRLSLSLKYLLFFIAKTTRATDAFTTDD